MNVLRVVVARTQGFKDWAVVYVVLGDWQPPTPANDPQIGEPVPTKPEGKPKLKF